MADSTFYSTAAQVLPLLVLAQTAERRLSREKRTLRGLYLMTALAGVTSAALGEAVALTALVGTPPPIARTVVGLNLALAGLSLYIDIVWSLVGTYRHQSHEQ